MKKPILIICALLGFLILPATSAPQSATVEEILERYHQAQAGLKDVEASASLDLQLVLGVFPYKEKLQGTYYYQQPDRHRLKFQDAPSYFEKAPDMFRWDLPSDEKYKSKIKTSPDPSSVQVLYLPKNPDSSTLNVLCRFERQSGRLMSQETTYRDGGAVNLDFTYLGSQEFPVLKKVESRVSIPSYSLTGSAGIVFTEHRINEGLEDSVFPEEQED